MKDYRDTLIEASKNATSLVEQLAILKVETENYNSAKKIFESTSDEVKNLCQQFAGLAILQKNQVDALQKIDAARLVEIEKELEEKVVSVQTRFQEFVESNEEFRINLGKKTRTQNIIFGVIVGMFITILMLLL